MENNMYQENESLSNTTGKVFTPVQMLIGIIIGGVFTAVYLLAINYDSLDNQKNKRRTLLIGIPLSLLIFPLLLFSNIDIPGKAILSGLGIGISIYTKSLLETYGLSSPTRNILKNSLQNKNLQRSWWHIFGSAAVGILLTYVALYFFAFIGFLMGIQ